MSRQCSIKQTKPIRGSRIKRSGLPKKKGGIGTHITAKNPRIFYPNLHKKRLWVPELNKYVTVKLSARTLKEIDKKGAYKVLQESNLI